MRYPTDGYNDAVLPTSTMVSLLNTKGQTKNTVTAGRTFWMRGITITNSNTTQTAAIHVYDDDTEGSATGANQRLGILVGPSDTAMVEYPAPGAKFLNGCMGLCDVASAVPAYYVHVTGYEE